LETVKEYLKEKQANSTPPTMLIHQKILKAHDFFAFWGEALWLDPHINSLLKSVEMKIAASSKAVLDMGLFTACRHCEEEEGGSCCGAGIENKYTPRLLLINLLYGVTLPEERLWSNSCFFLSESGCSLKLRHILCVNYLCLKVQKMLSSKDLTRLQEIIGEEMDMGFILDEAVKKFIGE
jgi:hypothetical protein